MCEANTRLAQEVERDLGSFLESSRGGNVPWSQAPSSTPRIRRNIKLAEAPSFGQSIFRYAPIATARRIIWPWRWRCSAKRCRKCSRRT